MAEEDLVGLYHKWVDTTLVYRFLSGMAPAYLPTDCQLSSEEGQLRSADSRTCVARQTCSNFGDRCFVAVGPMFCGCGTAFQLVLGKQTSATDSLSSY